VGYCPLFSGISDDKCEMSVVVDGKKYKVSTHLVGLEKEVFYFLCCSAW
jgi:hypothetical protein